MKKIISLKILILVFISFGFSQRVIMEEDVRSYDLDKPKIGPNLRHFAHWYADLAFFIPNLIDNDEIDVQYIKSLSFILGYRYKFKITNWLAIGADGKYRYNQFQCKNPLFFDENDEPIEHDRERLKMNNVGTEIFIRFNIGRRGNVVGKFLDIGAYADYVFDSKYIYVDNVTPSSSNNYTGQIKVINKKLEYLPAFNMGFAARIGVNRYIISAAWKFKEFFTAKKHSGMIDTTPRFSIGFQIGIH